MNSKDKVTGIIGGLGNEAMVDLVQKILEVPGHESKSFVVYGNSRLAYKPEEVSRVWQPDDEPELRKHATAVHTARIMQSMGCGAVGLACNSAHELFREVFADIPVHFVDMIHETARTMADSKGRVLVLGVTSLVESGLYQKALERYGVEAVKASPENQEKVMAAIYDTGFGIKTAQITDEAQGLLCDVINEEYSRQGCRSVVLGCTELPLALTAQSCARFKEKGLIPEDVSVVDASAVLARRLVETEFTAQSVKPDLTLPEHVDWFPPAAFRLPSVKDVVRVQNNVIDLTVRFLKAKGRSIEGSYMHLPTLFITGEVTGFEDSLSELEVGIIDAEDNLAARLEPFFQQHFSTV